MKGRSTKETCNFISATGVAPGPGINCAVYQFEDEALGITLRPVQNQVLDGYQCNVPRKKSFLGSFGDLT